MTERESEQFYHDLRQKLEGYGSAPPESVWAGIREQVPAQPKRRWRPLLLLLFLVATLAGITLGTRPWRQAEGKAAAAGNNSSPATSTDQTGTNGLGATTLSSTENSAFTEEAADSEAQPADNLAASTSLTATESQGATGTSSSLPSPSSRPLGGTGFSAAPRPKERFQPAETTLSATDTKSTGTSRKRLSLVTGAIAATRTPEASTSRKTLPMRRKSETVAGKATLGHASLATSTSVRGSLAGRRGARVLSQPANEEAEAFKSPEQAKAARQKAKKLKFSNEPLPMLAVKPPTLEQEEPEVRAKRRPRTKPTRRELRLRGWSTQLLLGSGLTYRALGGSPTQLERLEQPGIGFSGQVSGAYALTRQLTVSAGLGYAEYATNLNYRLTKSSADNARNIAFRDVYRFLTVPVQAQLTLQGNHRWRYGVQGGSTLALLTGARTTQGNACNCSQRQWQPGSGSATPYQSTNLLLNVGAFANYQFAPGQWLTIRPQAEIFLNSLTTQELGLAPRRPWNLGIQAGYSWDLDPRKH